MNDNENYLPWANFKPYYELSKAEFDKIGKNTCFRVRCKLCTPALKTIGTNRTSSSNLRKHLKCVHPHVLKKLDSSGTGRKKREGYGESERKYRKLSEEYLEGADRDLLCQLVNEYQEIVDCKPTDPELIDKKRKAWESLAVAFNEASIGIKRTPDQLLSFWETIKEKREKRDSQGALSIMSNIYPTHKPDVVLPHISYPAQNIWDNTMVDGEEHVNSENEINQPLIMTGLKNDDSCSNLEIDCDDISPMRYSESERESQARIEHTKRSFLLEEKFQEEKIIEQRFQSQNLRMEQELRKQMLKDEMEHKRKMMTLEISHQKVLNFMEKKMKDEEWNMKKQALLAEERRKEELHKIELSILRSTRAEMPVLHGKRMSKFSSLGSKERLSDLHRKVTELPPMKTSLGESQFQPDKGLDIPPKQDGGLEILLQGGQEEFLTLNVKQECSPSQEF